MAKTPGLGGSVTINPRRIPITIAGGIMELAKMSLTELRRLQSKVETEIRRRSDSARRDLLKRMQKMAADEGLSLSDVLGSGPASAEKRTEPKTKTKTARKKTGSVAIKYRHPENPGIGWSGRGRKPQWFADWIAQNKPVEELQVNSPA
jgi:DNA-binding protein H-NS